MVTSLDKINFLVESKFSDHVIIQTRGSTPILLAGTSQYLNFYVKKNMLALSGSYA